MSLQENKALVLRFVEQVQNQHNLAAVDDLFRPDFTDHSGIANPPTVEGAKMSFAALFAAFPDLYVTIHLQLAEGDQVMTYKTLQGTHLGEFMGIPATGKQVSFDLIDIFKVADGKIAAHWAVANMLGLLQQIGAMPAAE